MTYVIPLHAPVICHTHVMTAGSEGTIRVGDVLLEVDGLPTRNLDPQGVLPLDLVL